MSFQAIRDQATDLSAELSPTPATQSATTKPKPRGASQLLADFHELQRQVDAIYAEQKHGEQEWLRLIAMTHSSVSAGHGLRRNVTTPC